MPINCHTVFFSVLLLLHTLENTSSYKELITKLSVVDKLLDALQKAKENKVMKLIVLNLSDSGPAVI